MTELEELARIKRTPPKPTRDKGQRSIDPPWLWVWKTQYAQPELYNANNWRAFVQSQPFAVTCRETLISNYLALDWQIDAKDSEKRDELKEEIDYYTEFFEHTGDYSYTEIIEWVGKDLLDIPFGSGAELGREGDRFDGRVLWMELLDGGTLFPTLNRDFPVGQYMNIAPGERPVYFPWYAIDRIYMSPRTEIRRKGWGMAPPEKIYLAMSLIGKGDEYYAQLLLDTPEAGLLDLGDMEKNSAEEWVKAFKKSLTGTDGFKIPVLYEHENPVKFIPFGRPPTELMFDKIIAKYDATVAAGYGISLSDVGGQVASSGGETLAGSIRQERQSRRTGFARLREKFEQFFNFMLPDTLVYRVIDQDDEQSVAKGRAILSNATGWGQLVEIGAFAPSEVRRMIIADGLTPIPLPEEVPEDELKKMAALQTVDERPGQLGRPIAPSEGGHGEVFPRSLFEQELEKIINVEDIKLRRLIRSAIDPTFILAKDALNTLDRYGEVDAWNDWQDELIWGKNNLDEAPELTLTSLANSRSNLTKSMKGDKWWEMSVEPLEIAKDLHDLLYQSAIEKSEKDIGLMYEKGEVDTLETPDPNIDDIIYGFDEQVSQYLSELWEHIPKNIQNCVISGTRKALSSGFLANDVAKALDTSAIINDNNLAKYVRVELHTLYSDIIASFATKLSNTIDELLQEI